MGAIKKSIVGAFYALLASIAVLAFFVMLYGTFNVPANVSVETLIKAGVPAFFLSIVFGAVVGAKGWEIQKIFVKGLAFSLGVMILPPSISSPVLFSALYETAILSRDGVISMGFITGLLGGVAVWWSIWGKWNENPATNLALPDTGADDGKTAPDLIQKNESLKGTETHEKPRDLPQAKTDRPMQLLDSEFMKQATLYDIGRQLAEGADVNARDKDGKSPLHEAAAASHDNSEVIKALIAAGADINARDKDGVSAFHWAARNENTAVIKILLQAGADVDTRDKDGTLPLHLAAGNDNPAVIKALVQPGMDVNVRNNDGKSPLHFAASHNNNPEVIKALVQARADVSARDKDSETPLHAAAAESDNFEVIIALVEAGADVNAQAKDGWPPLHRAAASNENPAVIEVLVQAGADVDARTKDGYSPLHRVAANNKNPAVVEALVEAGADMDARLMNGSTPLHMAAVLNKNPAVVLALLDAGADVNAEIDNGETPLDLIQKNDALKDTKAYWKLRDLSYGK